MNTMERTVLCYLRTHRRYWGLSQPELAMFMGFKCAEHVSRIENGKRVPTLESALACQVLFGITPSAMFPRIYDLVEERVIRDVYRQHEELTDAINPLDIRKRELFKLALERAAGLPNSFLEV